VGGGGKVTRGHQTFSIDLAAIALRRKNIEPVVIEHDTEYAHVGIGMMLSPNGMKRAMRATCPATGVPISRDQTKLLRRSDRADSIDLPTPVLPKNARVLRICATTKD
jgi:2-polyprenyl-6-methoxyphenol hydroxylase-like FAD-dependent oxidoreductase